MVDDVCQREYSPVRYIAVKRAGVVVYKYSMSTHKGGHTGGTLTEAEWASGEKAALELAKGFK